MTNHETLDKELSFKDRLIAATNLNDLVEVFANHHHAYKVIDPQFITASFLAQESPITNILREPDLKLNLKYVKKIHQTKNYGNLSFTKTKTGVIASGLIKMVSLSFKNGG